MASLFKPWIVRYLDAGGKQVRKGTPGARKVKDRASKWYGQFVDSDGKRRRVPLATDKVAARQLLAALEREAQLGRAGVVDPYSGHRKAPIRDHADDYEIHLKNKGVSPKYLSETMRQLRAVLEGCGVRLLADLRPEAVERFLSLLADRGVGSKTRNMYQSAAKQFTRWCHRTGRAADDPLVFLRQARGEARRTRRALTREEFARLLEAARRRPLLDAMTIRFGPRNGQSLATISPETRAKAERAGRERALIYAVLVHTGLRRGELEALAVHHLHLDGARPFLSLPPEVTKNRRGADIPLRPDLAGLLGDWLEETGKGGTDRVFRVPIGLLRPLKRDLKAAGIPIRDEHGRTLDVHALRHTTASYLARAKVSPRIAQGFMRHSDIKLTMQVYSDPRLLDEAEALAAMPDLPLDADEDTSRPDKTESSAG